MLTQISPSIYMWSEIHGAARNEPYTWNSYVIHIPSQNILALIDPLAASEETRQAIETLGTPTHIVLTCEFHLRESQTYRARWGCQLWVNETEADRYDVAIDHTFHDNDRLWNLIDLIYVPGIYYPETVLLTQESGGTLIIGDLLCGGRADQGIPDGDLGMMGPEYVPDLTNARQSIAKLLNYNYTTICFGHGTPIYQSAKQKLKHFVEDDKTWQHLMELKHTRPKPTG